MTTFTRIDLAASFEDTMVRRTDSALTESALRQRLLKANAILHARPKDVICSPLEQLDADELHVLGGLLTDVNGFFHTSERCCIVAVALLTDAPVRLALLRLVAAAVRVPWAALERGDAVASAVMSILCMAFRVLYYLETVKGPERLPAREFLSKLLRSQSLHAASRQLAAMQEPLALAAAAARKSENPAAAASAAGAAPHQQHRRSGTQQGEGRHGTAPVALDSRVTKVLLSFLSFTYYTVGSAANQAMAELRPTDATAETQAREPTASQLCAELAAALEESCVMEHAARAMLPFLQLVGAGGAAASTVAMAFYTCVQRLCPSEALSPATRPATASVADSLRRALSGPCVQTAALSLGLASLCMADEGPTYGMSAEYMSTLRPTLKSYASSAAMRRAGVSQSSLRPILSGVSWQALSRLLALPARRPPPGPRSALAVVARIGWAAVESARVLAGTASGGDGGGSAGPVATDSACSQLVQGEWLTIWPAVGGRPILQPDLIAETAVAALECMQSLLARAAASAPGAPTHMSAARAADAEAEWWRLAVAVAGHTLPHADDEGLRRLAQLLRGLGEAATPVLDEGLFRLPLAPPARLAAALAAGVLPCLERLLRRAGQELDGKEAAVLRGLLGSSDGSAARWLLFASLLAYGESRDAASFLATLGKLLRRSDPRVCLADCGPAHSTQQCLMRLAHCLLAQPVELSELRRQAPSGLSPASLQLVHMLSFAACQVLPPFARLTCQAVQLSNGQGLSAVCAPLRVHLAWLPLLAARCCAGEESCAAAAATPGGDTAVAVASGSHGPAAPCADAGWRRLLLEEVGAVSLLGAALEVAPQLEAADTPAENSDLVGLLEDFVVACRAVAPVVTAMDDVAQAFGECTGMAIEGGAGGSCAGEAAAPPPWSPEALRYAASVLLGGGSVAVAVETARLAACAERELEFEGGSVDTGVTAADASVDCVPVALPQALTDPATWLLTSALLPPAEARRLLRTCANPACANLGGDSEAGLALKACSGCGAVGYCCRACQTEHWRAAHKAECRRGPPRT